MLSVFRFLEVGYYVSGLPEPLKTGIKAKECMFREGWFGTVGCEMSFLSHLHPTRDFLLALHLALVLSSSALW